MADLGFFCLTEATELSSFVVAIADVHAPTILLPTSKRSSKCKAIDDFLLPTLKMVRSGQSQTCQLTCLAWLTLKLNLTVGVDGDVVLGAGEVGVVGNRRVV